MVNATSHEKRIGVAQMSLMWRETAQQNDAPEVIVRRRARECSARCASVLRDHLLGELAEDGPRCLHRRQQAELAEAGALHLADLGDELVRLADEGRGADRLLRHEATL